MSTQLLQRVDTTVALLPKAATNPADITAVTVNETTPPIKAPPKELFLSEKRNPLNTPKIVATTTAY
jgi:hypothetical protein